MIHYVASTSACSCTDHVTQSLRSRDVWCDGASVPNKDRRILHSGRVITSSPLQSRPCQLAFTREGPSPRADLSKSIHAVPKIDSKIPRGNAGNSSQCNESRSKISERLQPGFTERTTNSPKRRQARQISLDLLLRSAHRRLATTRLSPTAPIIRHQLDGALNQGTVSDDYVDKRIQT